MGDRSGKALFALCIAISVGLLTGCAGREYYPKDGTLYYHSELPAADRALAQAKAAGKDKECPEAYKYVEDLTKMAYKDYAAGDTKKAIEKANGAKAVAERLCPELPLPGQ